MFFFKDTAPVIVVKHAKKYEPSAAVWLRLPPGARAAPFSPILNSRTKITAQSKFIIVWTNGYSMFISHRYWKKIEFLFPSWRVL